MTEPRDDDERREDQPEAAEAAKPVPVLGPDADPRLRPPDPAGTQPKWDPESLIPKRDPEEHVWLRDASAAKADSDEDAAEPVAVAHGPSASKYGARFQFALGALVAVGVAAVLLLVAVIAGRDDNSTTVVSAGPQWSTWHPLAGGTDAPTQIADHVGHEYRLPDGKQLVAVTGGPLEIAGLPVTVAMRQSAAKGGDINLIDGSGVLFRLCGLGPKCAITEGKASVKRHLLLRREALELALYSFRYIEGVDEAVVFLPPRKGQDPSQALYFRKGDDDLKGPVAKPLDATLVNETPSVQGVTRSPDAALVQTLTTSKLFKFSFTQANQDARAFLVLDPLGS